ncbi:hypothetical protein BDD43_5435 [Mucilaginibacter gracilis]|uniref:Uncharacterized protein n=1 Tax=Mucilaginibacter gracilis TaxID=423350 RepID=A0A495J9U5_9SPHI|nr:hypothetical protein [Mucilaginibacter gracilis]RKR85174.1 hypothetical protein BDD43_5435 [Mucilaginibacter gracilis]
MKRLKSNLFYNIYIRWFKSGFVRILLLHRKRPSANLIKPVFKPDHVISDHNQIDLSRQKPFAADVNVRPFKPALFSPEEVAVDDFFSNVKFEQVKDELNRWFFFGLAGHGKQIADLTPAQVECFKNELPQLISALYNYHRSTRKEAGNDA